jgi:hypothetical protein
MLAVRMGDPFLRESMTPHLAGSAGGAWGQTRVGLTPPHSDTNAVPAQNRSR